MPRAQAERDMNAESESHCRWSDKDFHKPVPQNCQSTGSRQTDSSFKVSTWSGPCVVITGRRSHTLSRWEQEIKGLWLWQFSWARPVMSDQVLGSGCHYVKSWKAPSMVLSEGLSSGEVDKLLFLVFLI